MAAEGIDKGNYPRYALFTSFGKKKKVRILYYEDGKFRILEGDDTQRSVTRDQLIFLKPKKTS